MAPAKEEHLAITVATAYWPEDANTQSFSFLVFHYWSDYSVLQPTINCYSVYNSTLLARPLTETQIN